MAALLFAAWMLWQAYTDRGPLITINFDSAGGVTAGETRVLSNDVAVGLVETVRLSEDLRSVIVEIRMNPEVAPYIDTDTQFWVVNARINTTEISGLSTLLSGAYIEVDWDDSPGTRETEFVGLREPPLTPRGTPGMRITLDAEEAGYIYVGSPVFHRQIEVGRVERRRLSPDGLKVLFDVFVEAPYHRFIYPETRFYGVSGVEATYLPAGLRLKRTSLLPKLSRCCVTTPNLNSTTAVMSRARVCSNPKVMSDSGTWQSLKDQLKVCVKDLRLNTTEFELVRLWASLLNHQRKPGIEHASLQPYNSSHAV